MVIPTPDSPIDIPVDIPAVVNGRPAPDWRPLRWLAVAVAPLQLSPWQTYGRLTVLERAEPRRLPSGQASHYWRCRCACGAVVEVQHSNLRGGSVVSCGCQRAEARQAAKKHGSARRGLKGRTYRAWIAMRTRCRNPRQPGWDDYGGRGISIAPEWESFEQFLSDMGECPEGMTLDRIDSDGGYGPGNCRWATRAEQNRNTRRNVFVDYQGQRMTISEAARASGLLASTLSARVRAGKTGAELFKATEVKS